VAPGAPRVTGASGGAETARAAGATGATGAFRPAGRTVGTPAGTVGTPVPA
jgi:hypothetical protein